ncbi:MAG: hypothetical protein EOP48_17910 [Sphingobacteriales bacterium]|nr:MAG: hypothetical protein EOP48_17910 [Sphingobacteriales bacterium]
MKRVITLVLIVHNFTSSFGQDADIESMIDSLKYLRTDTLDCSAVLYWRIIAKGDKAIPFLIDRLTDTTLTGVMDDCKKASLNVGEVSQFALVQIADFPAFLVTKLQFDNIIIDGTGKACWSFYDFFFINSNKQRYQTDVRNWYSKQKLKYKPEKISMETQTECQKKYGIATHYRWTE